MFWGQSRGPISARLWKLPLLRSDWPAQHVQNFIICLEQIFSEEDICTFDLLAIAHTPPPAISIADHSQYVRTRQGKDGQEGGVQEHQGGPAVPRWPHRSLPQEGQGMFQRLCLYHCSKYNSVNPRGVCTSQGVEFVRVRKRSYLHRGFAVMCVQKVMMSHNWRFDMHMTVVFIQAL